MLSRIAISSNVGASTFQYHQLNFGNTAKHLYHKIVKIFMRSLYAYIEDSVSSKCYRTGLPAPFLISLSHVVVDDCILNLASLFETHKYNQAPFLTQLTAPPVEQSKQWLTFTTNSTPSLYWILVLRFDRRGLSDTSY